MIALSFPADSQETEAQTWGRDLTSLFYEGEVEEIWDLFSDVMRQAIGSVEQLKTFQQQTMEQFGPESNLVSETTNGRQGLRVYERVVEYENLETEVQVQWAFDANGVIQAFGIRPLQREAPSQRLDYQTKADLRLPFRGEWFVFWGGRSVQQNYHAATPDQRFAYDLVIHHDGRSYRGEGKKNEDYHCFGVELFAPGSGTVVAVENSVPDNIPGEMNPRQALGNHVVLDHGNHEYSFLAHFQQGTIVVGVGDVLESGALLGRCGNSGNSSEPHLHYHLQDTPRFNRGEGLPAQFQGYLANGQLQVRGEPVQGQTVRPTGEN